MAEKAVYTNPPPVVQPTEARVVYVEKSREPWFFHCITKDQTGGALHHYYREEDGVEAMLKAFNKANLATKSEERRILERLVADGRLPASTFEGTPD